MRKAYLLLVFLVTVIGAIAQTKGSVKGIAFDTLSKQPVPAATITVLEKKDSSLVTFTMTDHTGRFELKGIPNGEYRLLVTHVNYHNSSLLFKITDEEKNNELGNIVMNDRIKVLAEAVVGNEAPPVTMIDDTIQYNAGSFKTQPNASVEQLLKKLPGVKVEKDGTIKAQGERVNRVLVDGKEFFGNDPKVATKNLPADAVDKVQVYDRQSEQAQLTGFEDGNYEKTINLKLKKDKKKGLFGKISAGAGNRDRYEGKFNVNSFKGARQLSAIGMGNNTNAEGFSFMDILNFTGALNQMQKGGDVSINVTAEEAAAMGVNMGGNRGINTAWGGGLNYNNIIGNKLDWQSNYFYNRYNPHTQSSILRQNFLPGTTNFYQQDSRVNNLNNSHRFNLNNLYQIDSFHSIRITPSFSQQSTRNHSSMSYSTRQENGDPINDGFSNNLVNNEGYNFKNDLIFRKKFHRKGRTLSLSLTNTLNESKGNGSLGSITNFYSAGAIVSRDSINQQSKTEGDLRGYNGRIIYTEPLWKRTLLELSAGKSNTRNTASKETFDYNEASGKFDQMNDELSNNFENNYGFTTAGLRMRKQGAKYNYSLGIVWQHAELDGKIISGSKDSVLTKDFRNLLPRASFRYNFTRFKSFTLYYNASTNQPTLSQLQPVPDNSNPLYIREGNPDLKQEATQSFRANLNLLSPYKNKNLFIFLNGSITQNKIVNFDSVNLATGVRKTRPVNVNGVYNLNANINYSMPLRFLKGNIEMGVVAANNKGKQFLNQSENIIRTVSLGPELRLSSSPTENLDLNVSAGYNYNRTRYSFGNVRGNTYFSQEYSADLNWELPKNFFLATDFIYTVNNQRAEGYNARIPIWNASFSKQFLKFNRGEIKITAMDILNRNLGISRTTNQNYIEDSRVNTLRRFFMVSFTYSLSKTGLNTGAHGGMRMITR